MEDTARHGAPQQDMDGRRHTMSISLVSAQLEAAGVPRSHRHIVRLCKNGALEAQKYPGASGEEWFVAPNSVPKVIGDLRALDDARARRSAPQHDTSSHVVVEAKPKEEQDAARHSTPQHDTSGAQPSQPKSGTQPDTPGQGSETEPATSRYVAQLEKRIEEKDLTIRFLQDELVDRRGQISGMREIIESQKALIAQINTGFAPVFAALARKVLGEPKSEPEPAAATFTDAPGT